MPRPPVAPDDRLQRIAALSIARNALEDLIRALRHYGHEVTVRDESKHQSLITSVDKIPVAASIVIQEQTRGRATSRATGKTAFQIRDPNGLRSRRLHPQPTSGWKASRLKEILLAYVGELNDDANIMRNKNRLTLTLSHRAGALNDKYSLDGASPFFVENTGEHLVLRPSSELSELEIETILELLSTDAAREVLNNARTKG